MNELGLSQFLRVSLPVFLKALGGAGLYSVPPPPSGTGEGGSSAVQRESRQEDRAHRAAGELLSHPQGDASLGNPSFPSWVLMSGEDV